MLFSWWQLSLGRRRRKNGKHRRKSRENRTVVNIFNRSIAKIQLRLPSLFILLCLTTIHHNINRKLLYIYFQHGTYFIRRRSSQSKIWIFIDMFEEGMGGTVEKFMAETLDVTWNIIEISFYTVVFLYVTRKPVCTRILYIFPLSTRLTSGAEKNRNKLQSTLRTELA